MTILIAGGAGFIGSNFVLDWMEEYDERTVNVDKLTYAGNVENLASIQGIKTVIGCRTFCCWLLDNGNRSSLLNHYIKYGD